MYVQEVQIMIYDDPYILYCHNARALSTERKQLFANQTARP